jgi:diguanylate cyclase (GGDEF)-like protein
MALLPRSLAIALVYLVAVAPGATAQDSGVESSAVDGLVALQAEVLLLVELDAFDSVPPALGRVHREWVSSTNGFTRDGLLRWLYDVDADGARALEGLLASGIQPSPALRAALGIVPSADRVALESGATIATSPADYVTAMEALSGQAGNVDPSVGEVRRAATSIAPTTTERQTQAAFGAAVPPATSRYPWAPVTVALIAVLLVGIGLVVLGRRRVVSPMTVGHFDRLLDAGRRMAGALDRDEISTIAVEEALALAEARVGAFVHVQDRELVLGCETGDLVDRRRLDVGVLARVAATGRTARFLASDEPSITVPSTALLVVPVIGAGRVTGMVILARPDDTPFTEADEAAVGRLVPMVGSAMAAADLHDDVAELSRTDALTGLGNRRSLDSELAAALMAADDDCRVAVVMLDVDHFKRFNDVNGHSAGDDALAAIGDVLRELVRIGDSAYRYGGEEYALLLRNVTEPQAVEVVERVRAAVGRLDVAGAESQPEGRLTISCGLVLVAGGDVDAAIASADEALYEAKHRGRNRLVVGPAGVPAR